MLQLLDSMALQHLAKHMSDAVHVSKGEWQNPQQLHKNASVMLHFERYLLFLEILAGLLMIIKPCGNKAPILFLYRISIPSVAFFSHLTLHGGRNDTCRKGNLFLSFLFPVLIKFLPATKLLYSFIPKQRNKSVIDKTMKGLKFVLIWLWHHAYGEISCWFFSGLICLCPDTVM